MNNPQKSDFKYNEPRRICEIYLAKFHNRVCSTFDPLPEQEQFVEVVTRIGAIVAAPFVYIALVFADCCEWIYRDIKAKPVFHASFPIETGTTLTPLFPNEITDKFFQDSTVEALVSLSRVSKTFSHYVLTIALPRIVNQPSFSFIDLGFDKKTLDAFLEWSGKYIYHLDLDESKYYKKSNSPISSSDSALELIGKKWIASCPNLQSVSVKLLSKNEDMEDMIGFAVPRPAFSSLLPELQISAPTLISLTLCNIQLNSFNIDILSLSLTNLTHLHLNIKYPIYVDYLPFLGDRLKKLTDLSLEGVYLREKEGEQLARHFTQLHSLSLENTYNDGGFVFKVSKIAPALTNLRSLTLTHLADAHDTIQSLTQHQSNLLSLALKCCDLNAGYVTQLAQSLTNLTSLNLDNNLIGDQGAKAIEDYLPNLRHLSLNYCGITMNI